MDLASLPPLVSLRAFEAAARHGSLSAAARELNVTHPAVAQQVRRLEEWMDTKLLAREGRGVAPTPHGAVLAQALSEGFQTMLSAVDRIAETRADRPLRITCTPTFAVGWLMPRIGGFRVAHPSLELMINPTCDLVDLIADDYDVAFRYGCGGWPGLESRNMVETGVVVIAAPSLLARYPVSQVADLIDVPWVQELGTDEAQTWLAAHGVDRRPLKTTLSVPGAFANDAIRAGEGVGITARTWVADDIAAGRLVSLFEDEAVPDLGYHVVHRPGPHRPALKSFLAWARREMGEVAAV